MDRLFKYINPKRVVDIGANIGNFSKQILNKFPNCESIMVEANPYCEPYLLQTNIPYEIKALSNRKGHRELFIEKQNNIGTGASFYKENTQWYSEGMYTTVTTNTVTLDEQKYFTDNSIDLLKLDVQGSELDILEGGSDTLARSEYVLIETSLTNYNQDAPLADKIIDKMLSSNFSIIDIVEYHMYNGIIFQLDFLFKNNSIYLL